MLRSLLLLTALASGCVVPYMTPINPPQPMAPPANSGLVVFVRPSSWGGGARGCRRQRAGVAAAPPRGEAAEGGGGGRPAAGAVGGAVGAGEARGQGGGGQSRGSGVGARGCRCAVVRASVPRSARENRA